MVSFSQEQIQKKEAERRVLQTQVKGLQDELQRRKLARPGEKFPALRQSINQQGGRADQLGIDISILRNLQRKIEGAEQRGETISQAEQQRVFGAEIARVARAKTLSLVREREAQAKLTQLRVEAKKVGFEPIRVRGVQRFKEIKTGRLVTRLPPAITRKALPPRKVPSVIKRAILFGDPGSFARSYRNATKSNSFTIAIPIRKEDGKIRVQDFNFRFENGKLVKSTPTGTALLTEEQYLKADKRRRDKIPGFTFGDTREKLLVKEEKKLTEKEISKILQLSIDPSLSVFNKEQLREEAKLRKNVDDFSKQRLDFYQNQINKGILSVDNANKLLEKDIDQRINTEVKKSEFFREEGAEKRDPTLSRLAFIYETERLKSIDSLNKAKTESAKNFFKAQAGARRFLRIASDTPSSFVELGKATIKLLDNPANFVPLVASVRASITKDNLILKGNQLTKFGMTRPGELIAEVGGVVLIFAIASKGLKLVGQLSKSVSKNVVKKLKISPGLRGALKALPIIIEVPEVVGKATGIITKIPKIRVHRSVSLAFKKAVETSKVTKTITKAKKKVVKIRRALSGSEIRIRVKKKSLFGRFAIRLKKRRIKKEKEELLISVKKRKKEKEERRRKLLKKKKREKEIAKLKKAKAKIKGKVKEKIKAIKKKPIIIKIKKKKLELQRKKEIKRIRALTFKRRRERLSRRKKLLKEQKFSKSKLGKLKKKADITISRLNKRVKELEAIEELPPGTIRKIKSQTRKVIAKIRQRTITLTNINKFEDIQKVALTRFKKAQKKKIERIQKQIPTPQQIIKQFKKSKALKKQQRNIKRKIDKNKQLTSIQKASLGRLKTSQKKEIKKIQSDILFTEKIIKEARKNIKVAKQKKNIRRKIIKFKQLSSIHKASLGRLKSKQKQEIKKFTSKVITPKQIIKQFKKSKALKKQQRNIKRKIVKSKQLTSIQKASLGRLKSKQKQEIKKFTSKVIEPREVIKRARKRENLRRQQRNLGRNIKRLSQPSPIQKASLGRLKKIQSQESARQIKQQRQQLVRKIVSSQEEILKKRIASLTLIQKKELEKTLGNIRKRIEEKRFKINNQLLEQTKLTSIQKVSLKRFNKRNIQLAKKDKTLGKEIKVINNQQKQIIKSKIKPKVKQQQLLKLRQREKQAIKSRGINRRSLSASKFKTVQLVTLGLLVRQREKVKQLLAQPQPGRLAQPQPGRLAQPQAQAVIQAQKIGQPLVPPPTRPILIRKPKLKVKPIVAFKRKRKVIRKKVEIKGQAFEVWARPLKRTKKGKRPKLIKVSKVPLSKNKARDLRNYITDTSLSRTATIRPTKGKPTTSRLKVPKGYSKKTSAKFRNFRIIKGKRVPLSKGKVIERGRHLLDTRQEQRQITLKRRIAQLSKPLKRKSSIKKKTIKRRNSIRKNRGIFG